MHIIRHVIVAAVVALLCALGSSAQAEVKKLIRLCGGKMCPYYEIVLKLPQDRVLDNAASKDNKVQMILPKGRTFGNAEALIYVRVSHKQKEQTLPNFIAVSQERWRKALPDSRITKLSDVDRVSGKPAFETCYYENPSHPQQAHEFAAFGIDTDTDGNDFIVQVVMSGHAKKELDKASKSFQALLRNH